LYPVIQASKFVLHNPCLNRHARFFEDYKAKGGNYYEVVVKDVAHSPHVEKPEEFVATLRDFISDNT